jgi:acyl carrier protein
MLLYLANINWDGRMTALTEFNSVEMRVLGVVKDVLGLDELPQNLECSISEELALDSLDQLSLFMALEDEFGGRIKEEDAEKITTLRDIVEYIQNWNNTVPNA